MNAVKLSYASPKSVRAVAEDLGIAENVLYNWRKKYTAEGNKTPTVTLEEELKVLRLENAELKMERDMLKKAAAYFAKLQK
jgi:transposase